MKITTTQANGLTEDQVTTVYKWLLDMPLFAKRHMNRDNQPLEIFAQSFDWDFNTCVYADGELTGFVQAESKGDQTFECHLFCARKTPPETLYACVTGFFERMKETRGVKRLIFNVRRRQYLLKQCLLDHGAQPTGETYREDRQTFESIVWSK
jgi:hypothetical protein